MQDKSNHDAKVVSLRQDASITSSTFMTASLGSMDLFSGQTDAALPLSNSTLSLGLGSGGPARATPCPASAKEQSRGLAIDPTTLPTIPAYIHIRLHIRIDGVLVCIYILIVYLAMNLYTYTFAYAYA